MADTAVTGGLLAVALAAVETIKWLVRKYTPGEDKGPVFTAEHERQLRHVYENSDRILRDMSEIRVDSSKIAETLVSIAHSLERVAEMSARTAELLDKIDRRQELEDELRRRRLNEVG